ncbi:MAG: NPCBM/NEW2 domain-containing protein [Thermoguttaceae bacterium]
MRAFEVRLLASLVIGIVASATRADAGSFYALFYDGSHVSVPAFPQDVWWSDQTTLGGRRLFATQNPVRILQDMAPRVSLKGPRVVMANGDVVPGRIVGFLPAWPKDDMPARLLISLDGSLITADPRGLVVRADRVLRVTNDVGKTNTGEPGSLLLTNGTRLTASAIRWSDRGLKALTSSGVTAISFDTIFDLSVPRVEVMRAVVDDNFYPPLGPTAVIGRLETVQGALLTYYREMTLVGASKGSPLSKYLLVQPSWSFGAILVPIDSIWRQSFREAQEVPLSSLPARTLRETVGLHRWPWRRNENVEGGPLASGTIAVDLGVGTHSCCQIAFELPTQAKDFATLVGLDRCIGPGACATCKIYADQVAGRPLFSCGSLRSGQEPTPAGPLSVARCRKLVLVTEWAGDGDLREAYPLDIGGHVDWLMPFVTVEADDTSYCQSLRRFVPGLTTWDLGPTDARRVRVWPYWDAARECWLPSIYPAGVQPLTIRYKLSPVSSANDLVELVFGQVKDESWPSIELHVDSTLIVPTRRQQEDNGAKPEPLPKPLGKLKTADSKGRANQTAANGSLAETDRKYWVRTMRWDLRGFHGRSVQLTLNISLDKQENGLIWREFSTKPAIGNSLPRNQQQQR